MDREPDIGDPNQTSRPRPSRRRLGGSAEPSQSCGAVPGPHSSEPASLRKAARSASGVSPSWSSGAGSAMCVPASVMPVAEQRLVHVVGRVRGFDCRGQEPGKGRRGPVAGSQSGRNGTRTSATNSPVVAVLRASFPAVWSINEKRGERASSLQDGRAGPALARMAPMQIRTGIPAIRLTDERRSHDFAIWKQDKGAWGRAGLRPAKPPVGLPWLRIWGLARRATTPGTLTHRKPGSCYWHVPRAPLALLLLLATLAGCHHPFPITGNLRTESGFQGTVDVRIPPATDPGPMVPTVVRASPCGPAAARVAPGRRRRSDPEPEPDRTLLGG